MATDSSHRLVLFLVLGIAATPMSSSPALADERVVIPPFSGGADHVRQLIVGMLLEEPGVQISTAGVAGEIDLEQLRSIAREQDGHAVIAGRMFREGERHRLELRYWTATQPERIVQVEFGLGRRGRLDRRARRELSRVVRRTVGEARSDVAEPEDREKAVDPRLEAPLPGRTVVQAMQYRADRHAATPTARPATISSRPARVAPLSVATAPASDRLFDLAIPGQMLKLRAYWDSRDLGVFHVHTGTPLPARFYVEGITVLSSEVGGDDASDLSGFFASVSLYSPNLRRVGMVGNYTTVTGVGDRAYRGGLYAALDAEFLGTRHFAMPLAFPYDSDGNSRIGIQGGSRFLGGRLKSEWFGFYQWKGAQAAEPQVMFGQIDLLIRLHDHFGLYAKYEYNSSLPDGLRSGVGLGLATD